MKALVLALLTLVLCRVADSKTEEPSNEIDRRSQEAAALFEQGRTSESKALYQSLWAALRDGAPSSRLGFVLNGLSKIDAAEGDYNGAIQLAKQSADVYKQLGDAQGEAHSRNNQGIAEIQLGQYLAAKQSLELALDLSRRANDFENQVQVLNNLGSAFYYPGSYSDALHRYDEAMALVDANGSATWSGYWRQITNFNQATLYQRLGRYETAMQIYRRVQDSSKDLTPSDRAHLYANLGALYRRLGDPYKALDIYSAAQKLYAELHDTGGELTVMKNVGIVYALDMMDLQRARDIFHSSIRLARETRNRREEMQAHLYLGETLLRVGQPSQARAEFESARVLAGQLGTVEEEWKSIYGLGKIEQSAGNLGPAEDYYRRAIAGIEKTRSQLQLTALRLEFFADKREAYDALIGLLLHKREVSEAFSFLERSRARNFQDRLQANKEIGGGSPLTIKSVRTQIPPETILLEFWTSGDQIGLIWCTRDRAGMMLKQLSSATLSRIRGFLDGLGSEAEKWDQQAGALDALFPDDDSFLQGVRHVLVVPDGWISYVPFDLVHPGLNTMLLEQCDISYLPSAALLSRTQPQQNFLHGPWTRELIAFGDPALTSVGNPEDHETSGQDGPERLPFSSREVVGIAELIHGRGELYLQENDKKKIFLSASHLASSVLHVSTHAFADVASPENSRLLFSPEGPDGQPDYLFLRELYDMDLSHINLATVSACDTERGKIIRGEGVQAFSRALLSAGATSSLTTLWRVDDEPTAEFMKQFYYLLLREHRSKAEALRLVKLKFLHSNTRLADPRLWAAFVLNGDGASPLPRIVSWTEVGVMAALIVILLVAALALRSRRRIDRQQRARSVIA